MTIHAPNFIIHASGSLGGVPDLGKRAYRLKFSVVGDPYLSVEALRHGLSMSLTELERQMNQRGFVFAGENTIRFVRRQPRIEPTQIRVYRPPSSREMLPAVMQGARFRAPEETFAQTMPLLDESERWEYIFSAVFVHDALVIDVPNPHEEKRPA